MGMKQELLDARAAVGTALHNTNTALSGYGVESVSTLAELPDKLAEVYEAGQQAEWLAFWDDFQMQGSRTNYYAAFQGKFWTDSNFKPAYDITIVGDAHDLFADSKVSDLVKILETQGVTLDTSKATKMNYAFSSARIRRVPRLSVVSADDVGRMFMTSYNLKEIGGLVLRDDGSQKFTKLVDGCTGLTTVTMEGVIGSSIDFHWSTKLSRASIESIVSALSSTKTEQTLTLSKTAVTAGFTDDEWTTLAATKTNWTITLA